MWMHVVANDNYLFICLVIPTYQMTDFVKIDTTRKKNENIYVPSDWERIVRNTRVYKMAREAFVCLAMFTGKGTLKMFSYLFH